MSLIPHVRPRRHSLPFLPRGLEDDPEALRMTLEKIQALGLLNANPGLALALQQ
jgi:hypothetical protein